mmetsp:Transcript_4211/g.8412  ORF Transcript_4211/g.8412 Transcript_4211/m.8412 type:complete len:589 (-) Transcript_4211:165-1931(-)
MASKHLHIAISLLEEKGGSDVQPDLSLMATFQRARCSHAARDMVTAVQYARRGKQIILDILSRSPRNLQLMQLSLHFLPEYLLELAMQRRADKDLYFLTLVEAHTEIREALHISQGLPLTPQLTMLTTLLDVYLEGEMEVGTDVLISGLSSDAGKALNGCRGVVETKLMKGGRFGVVVDAKVKSIKAENLSLVHVEPLPLEGMKKLAQETQDFADKAAAADWRAAQLGQKAGEASFRLHGAAVPVASKDAEEIRSGLPVTLEDEEKVAFPLDHVSAALAASVDSAEADVDPEKIESEMVRVAIEESEESAFEQVLEASELAALRGEAVNDTEAQIQGTTSRHVDVEITSFSGETVVPRAKERSSEPCFKPVHLMTYSRSPNVFRMALMEGDDLKACRVAMQQQGFSAELPSGAKIFVCPEVYPLVVEKVREEGVILKSWHVLVSEEFQEALEKTVNSLRSKERTKQKKARVLLPGSEQVPLTTSASSSGLQTHLEGTDVESLPQNNHPLELETPATSAEEWQNDAEQDDTIICIEKRTFIHSVPWVKASSIYSGPWTSERTTSAPDALENPRLYSRRPYGRACRLRLV